MTIKITEQKIQEGYQPSTYVTKPQEDDCDKNYFTEMQAQDIEEQRARNDQNYVYRLLLQAEDGNCSAIAKALNYSNIIFNADSVHAQELMNETSEMLSKIKNEYASAEGVLSDKSVQAAYIEAQSDYECENEAEIDERANELMEKMIIGSYSI